MQADESVPSLTCAECSPGVIFHHSETSLESVQWSDVPIKDRDTIPRRLLWFCGVQWRGGKLIGIDCSVNLQQLYAQKALKAEGNAINLQLQHRSIEYELKAVDRASVGTYWYTSDISEFTDSYLSYAHDSELVPYRTRESGSEPMRWYQLPQQP